jgi:hypothetical protein
MPRRVDATVSRYRNSRKIPPSASAARRDSLVLNPIYKNVISPADMNTVVNDILNESAGFTHKNGREDTSNTGGTRGGEPSTDTEGAAPSNCVELELCQFDRFAK